MFYILDYFKQHMHYACKDRVYRSQYCYFFITMISCFFFYADLWQTNICLMFLSFFSFGHLMVSVTAAVV